MKSLPILLLSAMLGLTACIHFKPAEVSTQYLILSPTAQQEALTNTPASGVIGIAPVNLPDYLLKDSLAVRKGKNEISYRDDVLWAGRLDHGLQQTVAANLARLLPSNPIRVTPWKGGEVQWTLHLDVQQFDVDTQGRAQCALSWRIVAAKDGTTLRHGIVKLEEKGPSPDADPAGACDTLSRLAGRLSERLANEMP
jgi:uncharacterized protein